MASPPSPQPASRAPFHEEGMRIAGAFAVLVAALLMLSGGLLWREHARIHAPATARPPAAAPAASR